MRIGVDARELCGRVTGAGRYLEGLLGRWRDGVGGSGQHEFVLYAPEPLTVPLEAPHFVIRMAPRAGGGIRGGGGSRGGASGRRGGGSGGGTWWEQVTLPGVAAKDRVDVWFSPAYTAPLRVRAPKVLAIHDLSFFAHPEWFRAREGMRRRLFCRRSAEAARTILTISQFSRSELITRLNVPAEKIRVIPPGVTRDPLRLYPRSGGDSAGGRNCSVLFVGSIFNRRHVTDLVRAFAPIARSHADATLEIVGDDRSYPREDLPRVISGEGLDAQVRWHRYVGDEALGELYARARAFAFLSEYEGLGLTPLEALAGGIPPVLLDTSVARESCRDAAIYVSPNDLTQTTRALELALFSEETRSKVLRAAPEVLARYDWSRAARETLAALEESA